MAKEVELPGVKRGRKSDVKGITEAVFREYVDLQKKIYAELTRCELPTRKVEAKKHVLRVASSVIALNIRTRRVAKKR